MNYNGNSGQGEAASYYASAQQSYQNNQYQQQGQQEDGPAGDRGVLGAIGGGIAGGFGGNKLGNKTGHSKLGTILGAVAGAVAGHKVQDGVEDWKDKRDEEKEKEKQEEEAAKRREEEDRKRREEEDKRRNEQQQQQHHHIPAPHHNANYAGNFSGSANDIRLDEAGGEWRLTASCRRIDGCYQSSSLSLNQILENNQGSFQWASGGGDCRPHDNHCGPNTYTVQSGDTLRDIACRFPGKTWQEFAQVNNIANPDLIHPGLVLQIPGGAPSGGASGNFAASARNIRLADNGRRLEADLLRNGQYCNASIVLDERIGNENGCLKYKN